MREILLTFDDGPHPTLTPKLLDVLARHGIKAMFFVLGEKLQTAAGMDVLKRAHAEGHQIGNHTFTHTQLTTLSESKVRDELKRTQDLIGQYGHELKFFRPPYGATNMTVKRVLREEGYTTIMWSVDTLDWQKRSPAWVTHAMRQVRDREDSLILMHDIHRTTVDNVESLISAIKDVPNTKFVLYA